MMRPLLTAPICIAGEKNRIGVGFVAGPGQKLVALHLGHALIRDDDSDVGFLPDDVERLDRRRSRQHPVVVLEQVLERDQDVRLVIDDQDRAIG